MKYIEMCWYPQYKGKDYGGRCVLLWQHVYFHIAPNAGLRNPAATVLC